MPIDRPLLLAASCDMLCRNLGANGGKTRRVVSVLLALGLTPIGAIGCVYVLFFAAGISRITGGGAGLLLGVGFIWLYSDFIEATPNDRQR